MSEYTNRTDSKHDDKNRQIVETIDVMVPVEQAYAQWTQFELFPRFMQNVDEVRQLDDRRMRWSATILGSNQEWEAEITEQVPDKRIAWRTTRGSEHAGVVTFHRLSDASARVSVQIDYAPQTLIENIGDFLGLVSRGVRRDLENFKEFIENRARPTGAWEGRIASPSERATPGGPAPTGKL